MIFKQIYLTNKPHNSTTSSTLTDTTTQGQSEPQGDGNKAESLYSVELESHHQVQFSVIPRGR